jgi:hypothetical protein
MPKRNGTQSVRGDKHLLRDAGRVDFVRRKPKVELTGRYEIAHVTRKQDVDGDADVRLLLMEYLHGLGNEGEAERREGGDTDLAGTSIANASCGCTDRIDPTERCLHIAVEQLRLRGRHQAVADAGEEREADRPLEVRERAADGRRLCRRWRSATFCSAILRPPQIFAPDGTTGSRTQLA